MVKQTTKQDNSKKATKVGRKPSFSTFVKNTSYNFYKYDKKRHVIRIKDGSRWRDSKEDGILSHFERQYNKNYF